MACVLESDQTRAMQAQMQTKLTELVPDTVRWHWGSVSVSGLEVEYCIATQCHASRHSLSQEPPASCTASGTQSFLLCKW